MGQRSSGFERKAGDEYMTPEWVAETLLEVVPMYGTVWEPACGEGGIARVIDRSPDCHVIATDIVDSYSGTATSKDFLADDAGLTWMSPRQSLTIVTNPPYGKGGKLALAFVRKALDITLPLRGRVAMLLPVDWDAGKTRQDLFEDFPGHITKITLTERIRWTNLPQSKNGPSDNHAWFCWDWSRRGRDMRWMGKVTKEAET